MKMRLLKPAEPRFLLSVLDGGSLEQRVLRLIDWQIPWTRRRCLLSTLGCAIALSVLVAGLTMIGVRPSFAQGVDSSAQLLHPTGPLPTYEVATVKPSHADSQDSVTVMRYIQLAFNLPHNSEMRVIGGPAWIGKDYFVIHGKSSDAMRDAMAKMTPAQRGSNGRLMQQALLRDRFEFRMHFETREMPVYELVVAKGGLKVKEEIATAADEGKLPAIPLAGTALTPSMLAPGGLLFQTKSGNVAQMAARAITMRTIATALANESELNGRPIIDETGLTKTYDFAMEWTPERLAAVSGSDALAGTNAPSLFTAMQEQLGLRLVPGKRPVEVIVIDHIERPSEN